MKHEITVDNLGWDKAKKTFYVDVSDLKGAGCDPLATHYGWVIVVRNPVTGKSMTFENKGENVKDEEGEVLYDVFHGIDGIKLYVFND